MPKKVTRKPLKRIHYWLSVDPGTPLGYAWWRGSRLLECGVCGGGSEAKKHGWHFETQNQMNLFWCHVCSFADTKATPDVIVCEWPQHFSSAVGNAAAIRGDIVKLSTVVGWVWSMAAALQTEFKPAPVMTWKGQLSKTLVQSRIVDRLGTKTIKRCKPKSHAWDAVGIGLWHLGIF